MSDLNTKQERVDRLNYFNDSVLNVYEFVFFETKQVYLLIEAAPVSTPYCL